MWKFSMFSEFAFYVLLLLVLPPTVNSKETPRMCAVCLEKDCATGVREIYPAVSDAAVWVKANSRTGIQNCSMENLKADAPCKMANGILVQLADNPLRFEGINPSDKRRLFDSQGLPCAELNLPPSSTPSPVTKTPIHNTPTPAAPNFSVADNRSIILIICVSAFILIVFILFLFKKLCNCLRDRGRRKGKNRVPPDAEDLDEKQLQGTSWKRKR